MGTKLNRTAYRAMLEENIAWLLKQPRTLERDHIEHILRYESDHLPLYKMPDTPPTENDNG